MPPCTMPNNRLADPPWPSPWRSRPRRAQSIDRRMDASASASVAGYGVHSSNDITMSLPRLCWTSIDRSGVSSHRIAVDRGPERDAVRRDLAQIAQAEDLVAARVGQDRPRPLHELVQPTECPHGLIPGPQHQVERVAEKDLGPDVLEHPRRHALHGAVGSARHENRRFDRAMGRGQAPAPCLTVGRQHFERHGDARSQNIASP